MKTKTILLLAGFTLVGIAIFTRRRTPPPIELQLTPGTIDPNADVDWSLLLQQETPTNNIPAYVTPFTTTTNTPPVITPFTTTSSNTPNYILPL